MAYLTPQQENRRLWILLVLSLAGLVFMNSLLTSCKPKPKPAAPVPTGEVIDTIRPALEQKAAQAQAQSDTNRKLGTQSVTDYLNAAKRYDSLRAQLDKN